MTSIFKTKKKESVDEDLHLLASWMAGAYSNQEQARDTDTYSYVYLFMIPVWPSRTDGYWFYVEQAIANQLDAPYRQRIYHLDRVNKDLMESKIYALADTARFVRAHENLPILENLTPDMISLRPGCSIILRRLNAESFAGSTLGEGCPSELRGAMYTTSQVVINAHRMISWDRGYDRGGKQVWGATMGGYIFTKLKTYEI
ncbi:MAG: chromophore lyase CpcT/CpeT [Anaerolineales bacterium]|nr:chromophore lyase CpcT/CpeT [Anaerolineales bacterium]